MGFIVVIAIFCIILRGVLGVLEWIPGNKHVIRMITSIVLALYFFIGLKWLYAPHGFEDADANGLGTLLSFTILFSGPAAVVLFLVSGSALFPNKEQRQYFKTVKSLSTGQWANILVTSYWDEASNSRKEVYQRCPGNVPPPHTTWFSNMPIFGDKIEYIE